MRKRIATEGGAFTSWPPTPQGGNEVSHPLPRQGWTRDPLIVLHPPCPSAPWRERRVAGARPAIRPFAKEGCYPLPGTSAGRPPGHWTRRGGGCRGGSPCVTVHSPMQDGKPVQEVQLLASALPLLPVGGVANVETMSMTAMRSLVMGSTSFADHVIACVASSATFAKRPTDREV
jgi:hypothetical protein